MEWKTAWSYCPINYDTTIGSVSDLTQRTYFKNNISGNKIKLKFSNIYSKEDLTLDKVVVGSRKNNDKEISNFINVTYQGKEKIVIKSGEEFYSDDIDFDILAGEEFVISMYVKDKTNIQSACSTWAARSWHTEYIKGGDFTETQNIAGEKSEDIFPFVKADVNKSNIVFGISEIKVFTNKNIKTVVLFGDSITHMSYYYDALIERIYSKYPDEITFINRGIGGNRVLNDATYIESIDGKGKFFGEAGIKRFTNDVLREKPDAVFILEGVNDIMHPYQFDHMDEVVTAEDLINGMKTLIDKLHSINSRVYLGTIMPFFNEEFTWMTEGEATRIAYNSWVRQQKITDGIMDFDKAIRDKDNEHYMNNKTHIGDGLHPNVEGGKVMADLVKLEYLGLKGE
ncbi:GDSL-type esterase/lipase family protein [Clostridium sp. HCS.1]|uniref:GDSL-type esterase/lipase family protein n=1 Tax=Clostridium sp. HCS.1 TaxID=3238594 RepID=UPI003A10059D